MLYIEGGNLLNHHQCAASTWMMRRQPYCARTPTTHQLIGGEETEWWSQSVYGGLLGGHCGQRPMGKFGQGAGVTPLLFFEGHPGIFLWLLMTTESHYKWFSHLDLRVLNDSVMQLKFKMLTVRQIVPQIRSEDWFVTIDLKDAYFHISILPYHRKFLRFAFGGRAYQYQVLPFGLAWA